MGENADMGIATLSAEIDALSGDRGADESWNDFQKRIAKRRRMVRVRWSIVSSNHPVLINNILGRLSLFKKGFER